MKKLSILICVILVITLFAGCKNSDETDKLGYDDKVVSSVTVSSDEPGGDTSVVTPSKPSNDNSRPTTSTNNQNSGEETSKPDGIDWGSMNDYLNSDEYTDGLNRYDGMSEEDLYLTTIINSEEELLEVAQKVKSGYTFEQENIVINKNLDFKGKEWIPIGTAKTPFMGRILGKGHTISNIKINRIEKEFTDTRYSAYSGFIGNASDAYIADLNIKNITISINETIKSENVNVGAIAGYLRSYRKTSQIINCKASGSISVPSRDDGNVNVGGIVGNFDATLPQTNYKLQWLESSVKITTRGFTSNVGGIAGTISLRDVNKESYIRDLIYIGKIDDMNNRLSRMGGIFGSFSTLKPVSVSNCFTVVDLARVDDNQLSISPPVEGIFIGKETNECAKVTLSNIYGAVKHNGTVVKRNFIGETHGEFVMSNCVARTSLPKGVKFDTKKWNLNNLSAPSFK